MGDEYPKLIPVRKEKPDGTSLYFGPFKSAYMTERLLLELRRLVPFCTQPRIGKRACFYSRIGYCDPCPNVINACSDEDEKKRLKKLYRSNVRKAVNILAGKTSSYTNSLTKTMQSLADDLRFEEAIKIRKKLLQFTLFLHQRSFNEDRSHITVDSESIRDQLATFLEKHFSASVHAVNYRLECYDMSNLFGEHATGSMVVFEDGIFAKKEYRTFKVGYEGISDIHMMEEVLTRRLKHADWRKPDVIILDGGKPQLRQITALFARLGLNIPVISIAKHPDRILTAHNNFRPVFIDSHSPLFRVIQALRDEAHRFAKKHHVALRDAHRVQ